jgi:hypothetical protein
MAEISDLESKLEPETAPLRPAQVGLYLKEHNAEKPCAACGSKAFTMAPEPDAATGVARGVVWLACDQCNALRTFLRPPIIQWLKGARHAGSV